MINGKNSSYGCLLQSWTIAEMTPGQIGRICQKQRLHDWPVATGGI